MSPSRCRVCAPSTDATSSYESTMQVRCWSGHNASSAVKPAGIRMGQDDEATGCGERRMMRRFRAERDDASTEQGRAGRGRAGQMTPMSRRCERHNNRHSIDVQCVFVRAEPPGTPADFTVLHPRTHGLCSSSSSCSFRGNKA